MMTMDSTSAVKYGDELCNAQRLEREDGAVQGIGRGDCLWPRLRPWAAGSLAAVLTTILICFVEIAYPRAILALYKHVLVHVWPAKISFRGSHVRIGGPCLAFLITSIALSIKDDSGGESIRDFAADLVLSKSFAGIFFVPPAILFSAIQVKVGWRAWSSLFAGQEFSIPYFLEYMGCIRFFPLQSVACGLLAYGIKRDKAALLASGIGGMVFIILSLAVNPAWISSLKLLPPFLDTPVP